MVKNRAVRFTKEGFQTVQNEIAKLQETRKEAVKEVSRAAEMGDRSENAAYKVGKQKLSSIDSRIRHLNKIIKNAQIVESQSSDTVGIGSTVVVSDGNSTFTYQVVGDYEADPMQNKISPNSPIGRALFGKKSGAEVVVYAPSGETRYRVLKIT